MIDRDQIQSALGKCVTLEGKPIHALKALAADLKAFHPITNTLTDQGFEQLIHLLSMLATADERKALTTLKSKFTPIKLLIFNQLSQSGILGKIDNIKSKLSLLDNKALFALNETLEYLLKNKQDFGDFYLHIVKRSFVLSRPPSSYSMANMRLFRYLHHTRLLNPQNLELYFTAAGSRETTNDIDGMIQELYHNGILNQALFNHFLKAPPRGGLAEAIELLSKTHTLTAHTAWEFVNISVEDSKASLPVLAVSLTYLRYAHYLNQSNDKAVLATLRELHLSLPEVNKMMNKLKMAGNLTPKNAEYILKTASLGKLAEINDETLTLPKAETDSKGCTIPLPHCLMVLEGTEKINLQWEHQNGGIKQLCLDAKRAAGNSRLVQIAGFPLPLKSIKKLQARLNENPEITLEELCEEPAIQFLTEKLTTKGVEQLG